MENFDYTHGDLVLLAQERRTEEKTVMWQGRAWETTHEGPIP
ncbi:hypothetical protein ES319_A12G159300v1 [Gossypium barbadense]|uniref:Uncharacterized protein n=2 Tax=Gossypium TaxID=3633 RepID=A0A5J5TGB3_GOSBA|nr:hypothetical protein ES319_A12G159300v1 [Gossypium barbadense]TYG90337.1 hypothetical protein ES288_A12G173700v1 [Gossypium darwinii]